MQFAQARERSLADVDLLLACADLRFNQRELVARGIELCLQPRGLRRKSMLLATPRRVQAGLAATQVQLELCGGRTPGKRHARYGDDREQLACRHARAFGNPQLFHYTGRRRQHCGQTERWHQPAGHW